MKTITKLVLITIVMVSCCMIIYMLSQQQQSPSSVYYYSQDTYFTIPSMPVYKGIQPSYQEDNSVMEPTLGASPFIEIRKSNTSNIYASMHEGVDVIAPSDGFKKNSPSQGISDNGFHIVGRLPLAEKGSGASSMSNPSKPNGSISLSNGDGTINPGDDKEDGPPPIPPLGTPVPEGFGVLILLAGLYFVICKNKNSVIEYSNSIQL